MEDHTYYVQQNAYKLTQRQFRAKLAVSTVPSQQIAHTTNFYTNVATHIAAFGMSIVPFSKLSSSTIDYFVPSPEAQSLGIQVMDFERLKYSEAIGMKIIPNLKCPQLQITMNQCFVSTNQDGYIMLKTILEMYIPRIRKPHTPSAYIEQTERPTFWVKSNPYTFQSDLNLYYQTEAAYNRKYTEMEKINVFLGVIAKDTRLFTY